MKKILALVLRGTLRAFVVIWAGIFCVFLAACGGCSSNSKKEYLSPSYQARANLEIIIQAINDQDSETIKGLLSGYFIDHCTDVDLKLDEMIAFIDGEIISYDKPFGAACGGFEKKDSSAKIKCFTTDQGTEYYIGIKEWYRYDEQPEQVGIYHITVKNLTKLSEDPESKEAVFRLGVTY